MMHSFGVGRLLCICHLSCCASWEISSAPSFSLPLKAPAMWVSLGCSFWTAWIRGSQIAILRSKIRRFCFYSVCVWIDSQLMGQEKVQEPNWSLVKWRIFVSAGEGGKKFVSVLYFSGHHWVIWWLAICIPSLWSSSTHISFSFLLCILS